MNKLKIAIPSFLMSICLFLSFQLSEVRASPIGDIFEPIYHLFNGLFQGALDLILFLFVIVLVLGLFSSPIWLKKIFGWAK